MMKKKKMLQLYTVMWLVAILVLFALLIQTAGDARIINYSGIVRGATQKLVKEELNGQQDDELIARLDGIISNLQTGKGEYKLARSRSRTYQVQLAELKLVWEDIKEDIGLIRDGENVEDQLYELSQRHFELADRLVMCAERDSNNRLIRFSLLYGVSLALSVTVFSTQIQRHQREQEILLSEDKLTGLYNRYGFEEAAADRLRRKDKRRYMIVEFDIDKFKSINNTCGYVAGDSLLQAVAEAVRDLEEDAICARINADDFVILMEQKENALPRLQSALEDVVREQGILESFGSLSFTYGAYKLEEEGELIKTVMDKANTAHKTAKAQENQPVIWYDEQLLQKLKLENQYREQMHHGIVAEEFKLYLQPKIDLSNMQVYGAESLVRWDLQGHGLVYPDSFIPLFEKDGTIVDLDFYMLEKTCRFLERWLAEGRKPLAVSVNFSRVTLYQKQFYEHFLEIVDRYHIPHEFIEVEITESAFNEITDAVLRVLTSIKNAGFNISMDDFGAGYSNLNVLSRLPIQVIKLDREFLWEMAYSEHVRGIVSCVVTLAHTMDTRVVCEGVEQSMHVDFLKEVGCDYAQGYYFSKPIEETEFIKRYPDFGGSDKR
ncbi:bifunctional diguanylate cyclase/phosphodiesterase [Clostridium sp. AN503]|uniref:putative bifunctional diguanylate cyclase/phosphodiesterase n=1 Tax=Clostridium sp. AN503 TaxID=3160598 RepID=UPI00345A24F5